jgi:hypothetical protein
MVRMNSMRQAGVMHLPAPLRAAVGLVATAADEARRLPDRALELPMLAVSTALQASVRAQQRYARLTARGDAVLHRTQPSDEPPAWATFDDPLPPALSQAPSRFDAVDDDALPGASAERSARLFGELVGADNPAAAPDNSPNGAGETPRKIQKIQPRQPPAKKAPARKTAKPAAKSTAKSTAKKTPNQTRRGSSTSDGSDAG